MNAQIRIAVVVVAVGVSYLPAKYAITKFKKDNTVTPVGFYSSPRPFPGTGTFDPLATYSSTMTLSGTKSGVIHTWDIVSSATAITGTAPTSSGTGQQSGTSWSQFQPVESGYQLLNPSPTPGTGETDHDSKAAGREFSKPAGE